MSASTNVFTILMDRGLDGGRRIVDDLVVHVGREQRFRVLQRFVDRLGGLELICARQQIDGHRAGGLAIQPSKGVVVLRAEFGASDVLDADCATVRCLTEMMFSNSSGLTRRPGALSV